MKMVYIAYSGCRKAIQSRLINSNAVMKYLIFFTNRLPDPDDGDNGTGPPPGPNPK